MKTILQTQANGASLRHMVSKSLPSVGEFQLLALVFGERSGREVAKLYKKEVGAAISYGTLYSTFKRLREAGWVTVRDAQDEDGRVRNFRITGSGVTAWESARARYRVLIKFGRTYGAGATR